MVQSRVQSPAFALTPSPPSSLPPPPAQTPPSSLPPPPPPPAQTPHLTSIFSTPSPCSKTHLRQVDFLCDGAGKGANTIVSQVDYFLESAARRRCSFTRTIAAGRYQLPTIIPTSTPLHLPLLYLVPLLKHLSLLTSPLLYPSPPSQTPPSSLPCPPAQTPLPSHLTSLFSTPFPPAQTPPFSPHLPLLYPLPLLKHLSLLTSPPSSLPPPSAQTSLPSHLTSLFSTPSPCSKTSPPSPQAILCDEAGKGINTIVSQVLESTARSQKMFLWAEQKQLHALVFAPFATLPSFPLQHLILHTSPSPSLHKLITSPFTSLC